MPRNEQFLSANRGDQHVSQKAGHPTPLPTGSLPSHTLTAVSAHTPQRHVLFEVHELHADGIILQEKFVFLATYTEGASTSLLVALACPFFLVLCHYTPNQ